MSKFPKLKGNDITPIGGYYENTLFGAGTKGSEIQKG
jgi:hypothetical protein